MEHQLRADQILTSTPTGKESTTMQTKATIVTFMATTTMVTPMTISMVGMMMSTEQPETMESLNTTTTTTIITNTLTISLKMIIAVTTVGVAGATGEPSQAGHLFFPYKQLISSFHFDGDSTVSFSVQKC